MVLGLEDHTVDELSGQEVGVARLDDGHATQHLLDDQLDVLLVDRHTLRGVDRLHLGHEVALHRADTADLEDLLRIGSTLEELVAGVDVVALAEARDGHDAGPCTASLRRRRAVMTTSRAFSFSSIATVPGDLGEVRRALRVTRVEQLDDTRQTVRDVDTGHTTGVEGPHRELRARLTDRLGRDDADGFADVDEPAEREVRAVAAGAHADARLAREDRAHDDLVRVLGAQHARASSRSTSVSFLTTVERLVLHRFGEHTTEHSRVPVVVAAELGPGIVSPLSVPQSISRTMTSCDTSTSRRVR